MVVGRCIINGLLVVFDVFVTFSSNEYQILFGLVYVFTKSRNSFVETTCFDSSHIGFFTLEEITCFDVFTHKTLGIPKPDYISFFSYVMYSQLAF